MNPKEYAKANNQGDDVFFVNMNMTSIGTVSSVLLSLTRKKRFATEHMSCNVWLLFFKLEQERFTILLHRMVWKMTVMKIGFLAMKQTPELMKTWIMKKSV